MGDGDLLGAALDRALGRADVRREVHRSSKSDGHVDLVTWG